MTNDALSRMGPILVTGATGFIGHHLVTRLRSLGADVYATTRAAPPPDDTGIRWKCLDLSVKDLAEALIAEIRPKVVFHLASHVAAAPDKSLVIPTLYNCLIPTVNILLALSNVDCNRLILTGTPEESELGSAISGEMVLSPYGIAKAASSLYAQLFSRLYSLPVVRVQPYVTYGPGQHSQKLVPYIIEKLLSAQRVGLSSGNRELDWIHVDDVVDGLLCAATVPGIEGKNIDLGTGETHTIRELAEYIGGVLGRQHLLDFGAFPDRPFETKLVADANRTRAILGWTAKISLHEGLKKLIASYKNIRPSPRPLESQNATPRSGR